MPCCGMLTLVHSALTTRKRQQDLNLAAGTWPRTVPMPLTAPQLFATSENVSQNTTDIATNTTNINNLSDSVTTLTDDACLGMQPLALSTLTASGSASKID